MSFGRFDAPYENDETEELNVGCVQIISMDETTRMFKFHQQAFRKVLIDNNASNLHVAVLSVAGVYSTGKSFLLNLFIRYFLAEDKRNWFEGQNKKLNLSGFKFSSGCRRETTGIYICDKIFISKTKDGDDVAVVLMDTQGIFDNSTENNENVTIFALSLLLSSMQIYNLDKKLSFAELQHLNLFTEYASLAVEDYDCKPFQSMCILIRNWDCEEDYKYGNEGGKKYLNEEWLKSNNTEAFIQLNEHFNKCFQELECFLLPEPGKEIKKASSVSTKDILVKNIDPDFKNYTNLFVRWFLSNIAVKEFGGIKYTCNQLMKHIVDFIEIYNGKELPKIDCQAEALKNSYFRLIADQLKDDYAKEIERRCRTEVTEINELNNLSWQIIKSLTENKLKSSMERKKFVEFFNDELKECNNTLKNRLKEDLEVKFSFEENLMATFKAEKSKFKTKFDYEFKEKCKSCVETNEQLKEVYKKIKNKSLYEFKEALKNYTYPQYKFKFKIKPKEKQIFVEKFEKMLLKDFDESYISLEVLFENQYENFRDNLENHECFLNEKECVALSEYKKLVADKKNLVSTERELERLYLESKNESISLFKRKLSKLKYPKFSFNFNLKKKTEQLQKTTEANLSERLKVFKTTLLSDFFKEKGKCDQIKRNNIHRYTESAQKIKAVHNEEIDCFVEENNLEWYKKLIRPLDVTGTIEGTIVANTKSIEVVCDNKREILLSKFDQENAADNSNRHSFEFGYYCVSVEEEIEFKESKRRELSKGAKQRKNEVIKDYKNRQRMCVIL